MTSAQRPDRTACRVPASEEFGMQLRDAFLELAPEQRRGLTTQLVAKRPLDGAGWLVPKACAELFEEWVPRNPDQPPGSLSHLSLETVAQLAIDVWFDEAGTTAVLSTTQLYQPTDPAPLLAAGFTSVNGKYAGQLFWLTQEERERFSAAFAAPTATL